jgi:hypothetical protein
MREKRNGIQWWRIEKLLTQMWEVKTGELLQAWHTGLNDYTETWQNYSQKTRKKYRELRNFSCFSVFKASWMGTVLGSFPSLKEKVWLMRKPYCWRLCVFVCPVFVFNFWNKRPILKQCIMTLYYRKSPGHIF